MVSCGANRNTAMSRFGQALNTRYNVYYNGKTHYDEQMEKLLNDYEDDYTTTLYTHPAQSKANPKAPQHSANFDRTIEKMQKAIQLHSIKKRPKKKASKMKDPKYREYLKREEYNPFLHNAWFLMGKAQYMNGDFPSAAATFHYITRHFQWLPELVQECQLWEAMCYNAEGWLTESDNILVKFKPDKIENKKIRNLYHLAKADYFVKNKEYAEAIPHLQLVAKGEKGSQARRLYFLLGQAYEHEGKRAEAYQAYKKASGGVSAPYRAKFNAQIRQSAVFDGTDIKGEVKALKTMTRYSRNKEFLDQIYYAIGNLYLAHGDTLKAIENYKLSAEKSTRDGIEKAIGQITLGSLYFDMHDYAEAQPCYASAVPKLNEDYPNYKQLKKRSDVLDELAVYAQNVKLQDSLLALSMLTKEEQEKVAKRLAEELIKKEKKEKEDADRESYLAQQNAMGNNNQLNGGAAAPTTFQMNTDNSWYFYNTAAKNAGKTAFQKQWGSRRLEDDWRRRDKTSFSMSDFDSDQADSEANGSTPNDSISNDANLLSEEDRKKADDPHFPEYYLKQIPQTDEERQTCRDIIQEGLFNMGVILKDKLEDMGAASVEFEKLLKDYPDNIYRMDAYYNLYLVNMRANNPEGAERYRQLMLQEFPDTKYGMAMKDPNYIDNLKSMNENQERMYELAYDAYKANDNDKVHEAYAEMMRRYPLAPTMPKFMFIHAMAYLSDNNIDKFKETLKELLERYPETDITPLATAYLKQAAQGRALQGGGKNITGRVWDIRLTNDTTAVSDDSERKVTPFGDDRNKPHYFVLLFDTDSIAPNAVMFAVAKHNFSSFVVRDFDLEQMNFSNLGLLIVKGFDNYADVAHYRNIFEHSRDLKFNGVQVKRVIISEDNFKLLLNEGRTFDEYFRFLEESADKQTEEKALKAAQDFDDPIMRNIVNIDDDEDEEEEEEEEEEDEEESKR